MAQKDQDSDTEHGPKDKELRLEVHIVDPMDTSAPILHELSEEHHFQVRWFKTAEELENASPWDQNPKILYILSDRSPKVTSLELVYTIAEKTNSQSPVWILTDGLNPNFREVSKLAGVVGWLSTPIKGKVIKDCLQHLQNGTLWRPTIEPGQHFRPKVGQLNVSWTGSELVLNGVVDEKSDFSRIPAIIPKKVSTLRCNWENVLTMNVEGLKIWTDFVQSEEAKDLNFVFANPPRMMREFWESMKSSFGDNVILETPKQIAENALPPKSSGSLEEQVQTLLTEDTHLRLPDQATASLNHLYLGMLTTICRYALSEIYLTREAVLDLSSRIIARCSSVTQALPYTDITRTFDLPTRMPLIASMLALYEPLLRTLVGILELLEAAAESAQNPDQSPSRLEQWLELASASDVSALPWQLDQLTPLENALKANLEMDHVISTTFELVHTAIEGNLSTIDSTGVAAFKLAKFEGPSPQVLANLSSQLRRAVITEENIQRFRHECVLTWSSPVNPKALAADASKLLLGTALEAREIGRVLDTHDTLQQIFDHRKLELERLVRGAPQEEIQEHLRKQAVTVLEKKVIGLYFNALAGLADEATQLSGLQMFSQN
jgi:hypothetical protein